MYWQDSLIELTAQEAKRIALTAQGFAQSRPPKPGPAALRKVIKRLHVLQLDPINVVVRAHYMPAFSRLGPYAMTDLDRLAYDKRELFEYIGHAASLLAIELHPLVRWRMDESARGSRWIPHYREEALAEVRERGPLVPGELSFQQSYEKVPGQWGGSYGKSALRRLAWDGAVTVAGRRGIEQVYDLTERVIPPHILDTEAIGADDAKCELLLLAAQALGVATAKDLGDYFLLRNAAKLLDRLVAEGRLLRADVKGWGKKAFLHPQAKAKPVDARALVSPFDSLIWTRDRTQRLFDFNYTIEIYVPAAKRQYGYYVYPFLMGEDLVARVDLKAERKASTLRVQGAFAEPTSSATQVAPALAAELHSMAGWLGLDRVVVAPNGDLAPALKKAA
jgi:uncharacterized protein